MVKEPPRTMAIHAGLITAASYLFMTKYQEKEKLQSEERSFIIGAVALIYMVKFGHSLPQ